MGRTSLNLNMTGDESSFLRKQKSGVHLSIVASTCDGSAAGGGKIRDEQRDGAAVASLSGP
jgi:hypothetical protein